MILTKDEIVDICKLIEECNIENISKFLVQQGIKKLSRYHC